MCLCVCDKQIRFIWFCLAEKRNETINIQYLIPGGSYQFVVKQIYHMWQQNDFLLVGFVHNVLSFSILLFGFGTRPMSNKKIIRLSKRPFLLPSLLIVLPAHRAVINCLSPRIAADPWNSWIYPKGTLKNYVHIINISLLCYTSPSFNSFNQIQPLVQSTEEKHGQRSLLDLWFNRSSLNLEHFADKKLSFTLFWILMKS